MKPNLSVTINGMRQNEWHGNCPRLQETALQNTDLSLQFCVGHAWVAGIGETTAPQAVHISISKMYCTFLYNFFFIFLFFLSKMMTFLNAKLLQGLQRGFNGGMGNNCQTWEPLLWRIAVIFSWDGNTVTVKNSEIVSVIQINHSWLPGKLQHWKLHLSQNIKI